MSSEETNVDQESGTVSSSLFSQSCSLMPVSSKRGTIKLSLSVADCTCTKDATPELPKLRQLTSYPKPMACPIPVSVTPSVEICNCGEQGEDMTPAPTCESEEEGTHEHKYSSTPCCEHNSQGVQPSEQPSSESCSDSCTGVCSSPLLSKLQKPHIEPRLKDHVPKSVEELKASITGLTGLEKKLPPGNLLGCEYIDYRCQISTSLPCSPTDSTVSFASCSPPRFGFSLTMEPKDHRFCTNQNECKHSREFSPPPKSPPSPPRGPPPPVCPPPPLPRPKPVRPCATGGSTPKPLSPPLSKPVCPPLSKPVQPPPPPPRPKPVCPGASGGGAPKPLSPPPSKPVCPAPPKPASPKPPKPECLECLPPSRPPIPPECPTPESPPSPCPSPPCAGGCERCARRQ